MYEAFIYPKFLLLHHLSIHLIKSEPIMSKIHDIKLEIKINFVFQLT